MTAVPTYSLRYEEREGYLFAHVQAPELDLEVARGYLNEIADECHSRGIKKVLVLRDIPEVFNTTGQFGIANEALELFRGIKICWVNPYGNNQDSLDFATTVATNRGANFGMFASESEAKKWLCGK